MAEFLLQTLPTSANKLASPTLFCVKMVKHEQYYQIGKLNENLRKKYLWRIFELLKHAPNILQRFHNLAAHNLFIKRQGLGGLKSHSMPRGACGDSFDGRARLSCAFIHSLHSKLS